MKVNGVNWAKANGAKMDSFLRGKIASFRAHKEDIRMKIWEYFKETFVYLLEKYICYILQTQGRCYIIFSEILNQRNLLQFGLIQFYAYTVGLGIVLKREVIGFNNCSGNQYPDQGEILLTSTNITYCLVLCLTDSSRLWSVETQEDIRNICIFIVYFKYKEIVLFIL